MLAASIGKEHIHINIIFVRHITIYEAKIIYEAVRIISASALLFGPERIRFRIACLASFS